MSTAEEVLVAWSESEPDILSDQHEQSTNRSITLCRQLSHEAEPFLLSLTCRTQRKQILVGEYQHQTSPGIRVNTMAATVLEVLTRRHGKQKRGIDESTVPEKPRLRSPRRTTSHAQSNHFCQDIAESNVQLSIA